MSSIFGGAVPETHPTQITTTEIRLALLFLAGIPSYFYSIAIWGPAGQDYTLELAMVVPWLLLVVSLREARLPVTRPLVYFFVLATMGAVSGSKAVIFQDSAYLYPTLRALVSFSTYLVILVLLYSLWRKDEAFDSPPRWIAWIVTFLGGAVLLQLVLHLMGFEPFLGVVSPHNLRSRIPFLSLRSAGWMGSPEDVGVLIGFLFPLAHYHFGLRGGERRQALFCLLVLGALLASQSRTGLGFFSIYFLVMFVLDPARRRRISAMVVGLIVAGILLLADLYTNLLNSNIAHQIYWRGDAQKGGLQILLHSPSNFFLGIGPSFGMLKNDPSLKELDLGKQLILTQNSACSDFINIWLFTGLGGFVTLLALWYWTFHFLHTRRSILGPNLHIALLSMALALFLNSLISGTLSRPFLGMTAVSFAFFLYFACLLVLKKSNCESYISRK